MDAPEHSTYLHTGCCCWMKLRCCQVVLAGCAGVSCTSFPTRGVTDHVALDEGPTVSVVTFWPVYPRCEQNPYRQVHIAPTYLCFGVTPACHQRGGAQLHINSPSQVAKQVPPMMQFRLGVGSPPRSKNKNRNKNLRLLLFAYAVRLPRPAHAIPMYTVVLLSMTA
jgi:hypothetical protein